MRESAQTSENKYWVRISPLQYVALDSVTGEIRLVDREHAGEFEEPLARQIQEAIGGSIIPIPGPEQVVTTYYEGR